jgi:hypothetical protein
MYLSADLKKHIAEFRRAFLGNRYEKTGNGLFFPAQKVLAHGVYVHDVNGQDERIDRNLLPDQGLTKMLGVHFGAETQIAAWYLAPFSGNVTVLDTWNAANFAANATEITSGTDGYTESTRRPWTPAAAATKNINSNAAKSAFTIASTSSLTIRGMGLLSTNTKGGTTGVLASAAKFATARVLQDTDAFNVGYGVTLSST